MQVVSNPDPDRDCPKCFHYIQRDGRSENNFVIDESSQYLGIDSKSTQMVWVDLIVQSLSPSGVRLERG